MRCAVVAVEDRTGALFAAEAARLDGMAPRRRATYSSGRAAARNALAAAGCLPEAIGEQDGAPVPPEGWRLSISHTDEIAVAVACRSGEAAGIGVDIETVARMDPAWRRYVVRAADRCPEDAGPEALTRGFALREAVFKALEPAAQKGARIDLSWADDGAVEAVIAHGQTGRLDQNVTVVGGYVLAVCLRRA